MYFYKLYPNYNSYIIYIVGKGGCLDSLFELSDVHVIGHVIARGPRVDIFSRRRAPYILPHRVSYVSFPSACSASDIYLI